MIIWQFSVHESLGETPCFMLMDREAMLPVDLIYGNWLQDTHSQKKNSLPEYVEALSERLETVHEAIKGKLLSVINSVMIYPVHFQISK